MRILGVDPGSLITGWGLVGGTAARPELLDGGSIRLRGESFAERLGLLKATFEELVERVQPESAAVESPFQGVNPRSALQLAHARGVVLAILAAADVAVAEYSPATIKKAVTGNGRATKQQVRTMAFKLLAGPAREGPNDLSDALATALCHAATRTFAARCPGSDEPASRSGRRGRRAPQSEVR